MKLNQLAFTAIKKQTCAIGVLRTTVEQFCSNPAESSFRILGTGFLIAKRLVITNRHVLTALKAYCDKESLPLDRRYVAFVHPTGDAVAQIFREIERTAISIEDGFDVGLIVFKGDAADTLNLTVPAAIPSNHQSEVGDPIAVYGYAFGEVLLKRQVDDRQVIYRFGPILQQGFISAVAPYDHSGVIDRFLLDVRTAKGMSGGPVFDCQTGTIIGIHNAGIDDTVAFAIPLHRQMIGEMIKMADAGPQPGEVLVKHTHATRTDASQRGA